MNLNANVDFLKLTQPNKTSGAQAGQNEGTQKQQGSESLKNVDIFTAAKNGIAPANKANNAASNPNERNVFGENSGIGDTYSFSTKNNNQSETSHNTMAGKQSSAVNFAQGGNDIQEIAEALGCEADENTVKNKMASMSPEQLIKLKGGILDKAEDNGFISMGEIEKKFGAQNEQNSENDDKKKNKIEFGSFTGTQV